MYCIFDYFNRLHISRCRNVPYNIKTYLLIKRTIFTAKSEKVGMTGLCKSSHSIKALSFFNCCAQTKMALLAVHRYCIKNYSDLNIFF